MVWKHSIRATGRQHGGTRQVHHPCHQKVTVEPGLLGLILPQTTLELVCSHPPPCTVPAHAWPQQNCCSPGLSISPPVPWCTTVPHKHHHQLWEMIRNIGEKPQRRNTAAPVGTGTAVGGTETAKSSLVFTSLRTEMKSLQGPLCFSPKSLMDRVEKHLSGAASFGCCEGAGSPLLCPSSRAAPAS